MLNNISRVTIPCIDDPKKIKTQKDAALYLNYCVSRRGLTKSELVDVLLPFSYNFLDVLSLVHHSLKEDLNRVYDFGEKIIFEDAEYEILH